MSDEYFTISIFCVSCCSSWVCARDTPKGAGVEERMKTPTRVAFTARHHPKRSAPIAIRTRRLLGRFRDNQEHFDCGDFSGLTGGSEVPLFQGVEQELCLGEVGREDDGQSLEGAG
jgi:hypothetical protein